jgi:hypothetical protein
VSLPHLPHPGNEKGPRQNLLAEPHRQTHPSIATESGVKQPRAPATGTAVVDPQATLAIGRPQLHVLKATPASFCA